MIRPYSASYECGRRLVGAGCPLEYLENLPHKSTAHRKLLFVRQLTGYAESRIYDSGAGGTTYVIAFVIGTDRSSGVVISEWSFAPPWEQYVSWDYHARDVVPRQDHPAYEHLFDSRLSAVLHERHLLTRGYPVAGLLCGRALESIPATVDRSAPARGELSLTTDTGSTTTLRIKLPIHRIDLRHEGWAKREGGLLDKPDFPKGDQGVGQNSDPAIDFSNEEVRAAIRQELANYLSVRRARAGNDAENSSSSDIVPESPKGK